MPDTVDWKHWVRDQINAVEVAWDSMPMPPRQKVVEMLQRKFAVDDAFVFAIAGKRYSEIDWNYEVISEEWMSALEPGAAAYYVGALMLDLLENWVLKGDCLSVEFPEIAFMSELQNDTRQLPLIAHFSNPQRAVLAEIFKRVLEVYPEAMFPGKTRTALERFIERLEEQGA